MTKHLHPQSRLLVLLFALFLGMGTSWAYNFSAVSSNGQTLYYTITNYTDRYVEVVAPDGNNSSGWNGYTRPTDNLIIPPTVVRNNKTYTVTSIGDYAFYGCSDLTSVTIPNSVILIGITAFSGCHGLTSVHYTGNLEQWCGISFGSLSANPLSVGHNLYINNALVTDLVIPNTVTSIGNYAFYGCSGLTSVTIPNSVTSIGSYAFYGCSSLTSVHYTGNIEQWCGISFGNNYANPLVSGHNLYINNALVTDLVIPNTVTSIGNYAFYGCSGLTSVTIPNSVTSIGNFAFHGCSGLISIIVADDNPVFDSRGNCNALIETETNSLIIGCNTTIIPNSVTSIGDYAFYGCSSLTSVTIPNSVTSIGNFAFSGCSGLTSVTIPNSVTSIGGGAFSDCSGLTSVHYTGNLEQWCGISFGDISANPLVSGHNLYINNALVTDLVIPNTVTSIGNYAFYGCSGLTSVTIPNSVTSIGNFAFRGCSGLTSVTIPNSVTSIGGYAFYGCSGLTSVHYTGNIEQWCGISFDYNYANPLVSGHNLYINNALVTDLVIPNTVTSIGNCAFYGCSSLTSVTIPNSVTSMGDYAFYKCNGLTSVTIGESVTSIADYAFAYCGISFIYSYATTPPTLGSNVFYGVTLANVAIYVPCGAARTYRNWGSFNNFVEMCPGEITAIANPSERGTVAGGGTFEGGQTCTMTATANEGFVFHNWSENGAVVSTDATYSFIVAGDRNLIASFGLEGNITFADANVKALCVANWDSDRDGELSYFEAAAVGNIGSVFQNNGTITSFNELQHFLILASIGDNAFKGCSSLTSVTIPNSVTLIGQYAFWNCPALQTVRFNALNCIRMQTTYNNSIYSVFSSDEYGAAPALTRLTIGNDVKRIPDYAFYGAQGLYQRLIIPASVTEIGSYAFYGCSSIPLMANQSTSLQSIGEYAFYDCSSMRWAINLPGSLSSIGQYAFYNCNKLTGSLTIPHGVTSIGDYTFYGCSGLTGQLNLHSGLTSIGSHAFEGAGFTGALVIPNAITAINANTFAGCSGLSGTLVVGRQINSIGENAFQNCSGFTTLISENPDTPVAQANSFEGMNYNIPVHVPFNTVQNYQNAAGWSNFFNYVEQFVFEMYDNDNWSDDWNWYTGELPGPDDVVCINSNCHLDMDANVLHLYVNNINDALTINNGKTLTVTSGIGTQQASQLVIAEGGQLFNYFDNAYGTVQRNINGYGTGDGGWYTIAAPFVNGMPVSTITIGDYDLYYYDEPTAYWMNVKQANNNFTRLDPAQGYLYANQNTQTLALTGQLNPSNVQFSVPVTCIGSELTGFNLVGNPYTNNISITDVKINGTSQTAFYRAEGGNSLLAYVAADNEPIKPGEGFMVKTTANGTLTFNNNRSRNESNIDAYVRLVMSKAGSSTSSEAAVVDRAYLRLNEGKRLEKMSTSNAHSLLYFKNGDGRYAVANNEVINGATPLYLEKTSGTYTIEAALLNAECDYLHLIDHLTSANIDLLKTPTYTFTAKPSDYEARFELVFDKNWNGATAGSESFAYYNGSAWVIANEGPATLQVVDMMGRVLSTETFCGNVETNIDAAPGVYVFRLINGDKVKVQKIVVRR